MHLLLAAFLSTLICSAQLKPCYSINGELTAQIPCDPSANVSACCPTGQSCATNLYCHGDAAAGDTFDRVGGCTDKTGSSPACPFPFLQDPRVWNWFSYEANTTNCGDGTFCMDSGNETCCFNHEGIKETTYHNTAPIPTVAEAWSTYYVDAGYSVPTTTSKSSTSTFLVSKVTSISSTSTTIATQSQSRNLSQPSTEQSILPETPNPTPASTQTTAISPSEKAIIGTASSLGVLGAVGALFLFRRSRNKRSKQFGPKSTSERAELTGHDAPTELHCTCSRPLGEGHPGWRHELMGDYPRTERIAT